MFRALLAPIIRSTTVYAPSGTSTHRTTAFLRGRVYILPRRKAVVRCVLVPEAAYTVVLLMMGARSARNM
jgi:hypothetical protein